MIRKNAVEPKLLVDHGIDCDQVFERLTAGPFPQDGLRDEFVQGHLRCCHECRSFAEAMRPAVGLFHEALAEQARVDLPVFTGVLSCDDRVVESVRQTFQQAATETRVADRSTEFARRIRVAQRWPIAVAVAVSVLLLTAFASGFGLYSLLDPARSQIAAAGADQPRANAFIDIGTPGQPVDCERVEQWIASVGCSDAGAEMHAICAQQKEENGSVLLLKRICCAECHASASEVRAALDADQIASLVQACGKCHDWSN